MNLFLAGIVFGALVAIFTVGVCMAMRDRGRRCTICGSDTLWEACWNCEEGFSHHECGEDICFCPAPEPNVVCYICGGRGGLFFCDDYRNQKHREYAIARRAAREMD